MAISFGAIGTRVSGTGAAPTLSPVSPSSTSNSLNFLTVGWKASSIVAPTVTTSSGSWTLLTSSVQGTVTASGDSVGSSVTSVYYALGTAPSGTSVVFVGTVGLCQAVIHNYTKASNQSWLWSTATAEDDTSGNNYAALSTTNMSAIAASWIMACTHTNQDLGTPSAVAITATGLTMTSTTSRFDTSTTLGDDGRLQIYDDIVASGTESAGPQFAYTNANAARGTTAFVNFWVITSPTITVAAIPNFAETAGYEVTISGMNVGYTQYSVSRTDNNGTYEDAIIRGGNLDTVTGSTLVLQDYEFHFGSTANNLAGSHKYNLNLYYNSVLTQISTSNLAPRTDWETDLTGDGYLTTRGPRSYLSIPLEPALNAPIYILEYETYGRAGRFLSSSDVLGRKMPVIATDLMSGRKGSFTMMVPDGTIDGYTLYVPDSVYTMERMLETGNVYQLRNLDPYVSGMEDVFFVIDDITITRMNKVAAQLSGDHPLISIEVSWTEVDAPPTSITASSNTWTVVNSTYTTWTAVQTNNTTWLDTLQT